MATKTTSQDLQQELAFLKELNVSLNAALFMVDRLTEEVKEEEGRLENDQEADRLFRHLSEALAKINALVKSRSSLITNSYDEIKKESPKDSLF